MAFGFYRRHPMAPEASVETPPPTLPEVDPVESLLEQSLLETPPAEKAFQELRPPSQAEYAPSGGRKILSVLAAALGGYTEGAGQGFSMGRTVLDSPYSNAMARYNEKAKALGSVAAVEERQRGRQRLGWENVLRRRDRKQEQLNKAEVLKNKPSRQLKPDVEYDEKGYATGRYWDPDEKKMYTDPELKGFRRSAESPTMTAKKSANQVALDKATELEQIFDRLTDKGKSGTWHVGPVQGNISDWLTGVGAIDDPDIRDLHMLTEELANERLYALSGAQINNKEYLRLRRTMASTKKSEASFRTDLQRYLRFHKAAMKGLISENDVDWVPEMSDDPEINPGAGGGPAPTTEVTGSMANKGEVEPRRHRPIRVE